MISAQQLDALDSQTRQAVQSLLAQVQQRDAEIAFKQALIDKLTHEMAVLKRLKFAATSERFASTLVPEQRSLLEETAALNTARLVELAPRKDSRYSAGTWFWATSRIQFAVSASTWPARGSSFALYTCHKVQPTSAG